MTSPTAGTAAAPFGCLHILQRMWPERSWSAPVVGSLSNVQKAQDHMLVFVWRPGAELLARLRARLSEINFPKSAARRAKLPVPVTSNSSYSLWLEWPPGPQQRHTGVQQFTLPDHTVEAAQLQLCAGSERLSLSLSDFLVGFVIGFVGQWIPSPSGASSSHTGRPHSIGRRPKTCLTLAAVPTS